MKTTAAATASTAAITASGVDAPVKLSPRMIVKPSEMSPSRCR